MHPVIAQAQKEKRNLLEHEALILLEEYGIPVPKYALVKSDEEAAAAAAKIGYPVVMKIVSQDILHKSDVGGVKVNIKDEAALLAARREILSNIERGCAGANVAGMLLVQNASPGLECIVGMTRDPQLGAALMFGLGGVFVELLKDVSFQLMPVSHKEAEAMIHGIKGAKLLTGYRGGKPKDIAAIARLITNVGALVADHPEIQEIDVNPFFAYEDGLMVVDARILIK